MEEAKKAKKVVELTKDGSKVSVTLFENGEMTSCIEEGEAKSCESYKGDEKLCDEYVEHLKSEGYQVTEAAPEVPASGASLPQFLASRETPAEETEPEEETPAAEEETPAEETELEEAAPAAEEEELDETAPTAEEEPDETQESDEPEESVEDVDDDARE